MSTVPLAPFGQTGHDSSRVLFGAAALSRADEETSAAVREILIEFGVNHIDTAAGYGEAELRIAPWLVGDRDRWFLATKCSERTGDGARASLERSLERMGVSSVDLIQLHNLVEEDEWDVAFSPGGAVDALVRAREEGLVRFIGVTGHGLRIPQMHLRSLERFAFDSVLFPYNWRLLEIESYRSDVESLIEVCLDRGIAIQTIKSIARRRWAEQPEVRHSWYEPITDGDAIARAVRFVLGRPGLFVNSSSDYRLLPLILGAASDPGPIPSDEDLAADAELLATEPLFDGDLLERI